MKLQTGFRHSSPTSVNLDPEPKIVGSLTDIRARSESPSASVVHYKRSGLNVGWRIKWILADLHDVVLHGEP